MTQETDLLGHPLTDRERELLEVYQALKRLAADATLPPCAERNVKKALSCMWQVANDLDLAYEPLYDLGV